MKLLYNILMMSNHKKYMRMCFELALLGKGQVSPNPMVGCVVLDKDGNIVSKGYHKKYGENHAERDALLKLQNNEAEDGTLYVNLEPCSHYGKTPPCCDMIIARGIPRVVIGSADPNPQVDGAGISRMRAAGIDVTVGVLEEECLRLNRAFFTSQMHKRPYVTLKWAQSADGYIDLLRDGGSAVKISSPVSQVAVHKLRAQHDAILVGRHTALLDDPSLDIRHWTGRAPLRLVIDKNNSLPAGLRIFDGVLPTIVYTAWELDDKFGKNVEQIKNIYKIIEN